MQDIFAQDFEAIQAHELEIAKQMALKFVSARMRTTHEVLEHLQKKGCSFEQSQAAVLFLKEYQYLDDAAYCRAWIHDRIQFHPCGRRKMEVELRKKVSNRQLIQESLDEYFSREEEIEQARLAAEQKMRSNTGRKKVSREQLSRFLYTRGYDSSIIADVCAAMCFSADSSADDFSWQDEF
ncbi:MAG: regulatory protein RecX [Peptococcaceae bacterium]|nr:regulatory protein RecX [Peptococcaceae bacterium]